ncbi:MAG: SET domain-containing protein [Nitrospiraceae bacterium]
MYTGKLIHPGDEVLRFNGPLMDFEGTVALGERECDALQIGPNLYIHLDEPGCLVNHSCVPNTGVMDDLHLVALRTIYPGQEICFDYSTTMDDGHWTMECRCGEVSCRGRILDFRQLPAPLQRRYLQQGIVQSFLAREFDGAPVRQIVQRPAAEAAYSAIDAK